MKKKLFALGALSATFILGLGLVAVKNSTQLVSNVVAETHKDNYDPYTYSGSYYSGIDASSLTEGLNGSLRTSLTSLIYPNGWYSYSGSGTNTLSTQLQYADEDPTNSSNMVYLYTRNSVKKNAANSWNREHVWPQSLSNGCWGEGKAGTDILHIRPTYNTTNSTRSNYPYGDTGKTTPKYYDPSTGKTTTDSSKLHFGYLSGGYFEPLDCVKGDVARIIMYTWTAYKNYYSNLPSITNVFKDYDTLLKWHTEDKPDVLEGNRNDYSETSNQKNRNPFVDHPEYAWMIFGESASASIKQECMDTYPADGGTAKTMTGITLTGHATKNEYYAGDSFNPTGLVVTGNYNDGSTKDIALNSCMWTPNPLLEGTTTVTCTYGKFTAKYVGISVAKKPDGGDDVEGDVYEIVFKSNNNDGSAPVSTYTLLSDQVESNTLIESAVNCNKLYPGTFGLKVGSGSGGGSLKLSIKNDAKEKIKRVEVITKVYSSDSSTFTMLLDERVVATSAPVGVDFSKNFDNGISASTISIEIGPKRGYLTSIKFIVEEKVVPPSPGPGGDDSSSIPSTSEESSSSVEPSVSSEDVSSSDNENNDSAPEEEKSTHGCGGSIIGTTSILGVSALIGLVFIFSKKRK